MPRSSVRSHRPHLYPAICALLVLAMILAGCNFRIGSSDDGDGFNGPLIFWYSTEYLGEQAAVDSVLKRFQALHPNVKLLTKVFPDDASLIKEFITATNSGLGPDLLMTYSPNLPTLLEKNLVRSFDKSVTPELLQQFLASALVTLSHDGSLYGLPVALDTQGLYYNTGTVTEPATTLDQLLSQARDGKRVAMGGTFLDGFWGFRAFGAQLIDPVTGEAALAPGGFVNWLTWLQQARETPNFVFDSDTNALRKAFGEGKYDYYIGTADQLPELSATLGKRLGVAPLPSGPRGGAAPFLLTKGLLVNAAAAPAQQELAVELATFMTNPEQQLSLLRNGLYVPANLNTRISPGAYADIAAFEAQARGGIPWTGAGAPIKVLKLFYDTYARVVEGQSTPGEAVARLVEQYRELTGEDVAGAMPASCEDVGQISLAAVDTGSTAAMMQTLVDGFVQVCPNITVDLQLISLRDSIKLYGTNAEPALTSDVSYYPQSNVHYYIQKGLIADITDLVNPDVLQSLRPIAVEALSHAGRLYGMPIDIDPQAMFYNKSFTLNPAVMLEDLRTEALSGTPIALDGSFGRSFWGVGAFGGQLFNAEDEMILTPQPVLAWLEWLVSSRDQYGVTVSMSDPELHDAFAAGKTAYYLGLPDDIAPLSASLGEDLGVAIVPEGPVARGRPLMWVGALVVNANTPPERRALAARFLSYAAGVTAQTQLMNEVRIVPANASVNTARDPFVATFAAQARSAELLSDQPGASVVLMAGNAAFRKVLENDVAPVEAVESMFSELTRISDLAASEPLSRTEYLTDTDALVMPSGALTATIPLTGVQSIESTGAVSVTARFTEPASVRPVQPAEPAVTTPVTVQVTATAPITASLPATDALHAGPNGDSSGGTP